MSRKNGNSAIQKAFEKALAEYKKTHAEREIASYIRGWNHKCFDTTVVVPEDKPSKKVVKGPRKKLDAKTVKKIRREFERKTKPLSQSDICKKYEMSPGTVSGIVNYKTWRDV